MKCECNPWRFLRILRLQRTTQQRLAYLIGISGSMVHDRIWGKVKWRHAEAMRVCDALGITRAEFKACYPYIWPLMGGD